MTAPRAGADAGAALTRRRGAHSLRSFGAGEHQPLPNLRSIKDDIDIRAERLGPRAG